MRFRLPKTIPLAASFAGRDLKLGVTLISLFGLLNKVAGTYGIMAVFTGGAEGAQLTMYIYSIASIVVFIWGMQKINDENGPKTLLYAHLFVIDHLISTVFTALFAVIWFAYTPHDGERVANSEAQKAMMGGGTGASMDPDQRKAAALALWKSERGFSAVVIVLGWFLKVYFIFCLYSFALHLRRGTYHTLPQSRPSYSSPIRRGTRSLAGARYSHLRGASVATTDDGGDDIDTTLAETLWEDAEPVRFDAEEGSAARGTGMTRSLSNWGIRREGATSPAPEKSNPFTRILARLSTELVR